MSGKPILALDFDGVIHSYEKGWHDGSIYGTPTKGFKEWAKEASKYFRLIVVSSRMSESGGMFAIKEWMSLNEIDQTLFEFSTTRPPAFLTIDDRALTFEGAWKDLPPEGLRQFVPWNQAKGAFNR